MLKVCVTSTSAVFEPRTTATATTAFTRFKDGAALGTYGTDCCRCGCWCLYVGISRKQKRKNALIVHCLVWVKIYLHTGTLELTFAGLHALKPSVLNVAVTSASAVLKPSTARSATTGSAGFLERATLWARHHVRDCWCDWRSDD